MSMRDVLGQQVRGWVVTAVLSVILISGVQAGVVPMETRRVASGLSRPVMVTYAPGDYQRLFVLEQRGRIRILDLESLTLNAGYFLDIDALVTGGISGGDERGMLGLAFHPEYQTNGYFYVYYFTSGNMRLARYSVSSNPDVADASSALTLLNIGQPQSNHNGGHIAFGPVDGYLYVGSGDGGNFDDTGPGHAPGGNSQSGTTMLGKMLRLDVDGGFPYAAPSDNPFVGVSSHLDEIWSKGLRNPYRWSFDRDTGDMYIGDVGQNVTEEIDFESALDGGRNYGWRCFEGSACYLTAPGCSCPSSTIVPPVHEYSHAFGCTVIGGYAYRGCAMPDMHGTYFFADYCSAKIWSGVMNAGGTSLDSVVERTTELDPPPGHGAINLISGFGEDALGELYICDLGGEVFKIVPAAIASVDADSDYTDDSCEVVPIVDCNGNGISDAVDIAGGTSIDCNANTIPDECEIDAGDALDCNLNGLLDVCDIGSGLSTDVDGNGVPDECQVGPFVRGDCNVDGGVNLADVVHLLAHLFGSVTPSCNDACDNNDDGQLDLADPLFQLDHIFGGGSLPASPYPGCGFDGSADTLGCLSDPACP